MRKVLSNQELLIKIREQNPQGRFKYEDDEKMEKPFDWGQMIRLLHYMKPYRRRLIPVILTTMFFSSLAKLLVPFLISVAIDRAMGQKDVILLFVLVGTLAGLYLIQWLANRYRILTTNKIGQLVIRDLRSDLFQNIQRLSFNFFDKRPAGSVLVRVTNDVNSLQDLFTNGVINLIMDIFLLFGIIFFMMILHWKLALTVMFVVPIMFLLSTRLRIKIRRGWQEVRTKQSRINAHLNESIQGIRVTQAFTQQKENMKFFAGMNDENSLAFRIASKNSNLFGPLVEITGAVGTCFLFWYGSHLLATGELTIGILVAFANYLGNFWEPIARLGQVYSQMLVAMASSERIFEFLDEKPVVDDAENAIELPLVRGDVEFKQIEYEYEKGRPALKGINLSVQAGETVALVGHTGSGKSTMINLLCRFYDPVKGKITIDGHDLREVTLHSLRSQIGIVLQDTFIFSGTIRDNIRFGRLDATDEEIEGAAKTVGAHSFIMNLPKGYDTEVEERGNILSMGERQLLSFARAILSNPRILILDEATASIDTETELKIQEAIKTMMTGRTSFVIAHRLSTIRHADKIVVLDHGKIVEMGNHSSLMKKRGAYYQLVMAQFRAFRDQETLLPKQG